MVKTDRFKEKYFSASDEMRKKKTDFYRHCTFAAVILFILLLVSASPASAKEWTLTTNDTISDNVTLASSGDTLILNPGTYYQNGNGISINKDITIKANASAGGTAENTIIDGGNQNGIFYSSDNTFVIDNLTLKDGKDGNGLGGGVHFTSGGSLTAASCVFSGCSATEGSGYGGAIYSEIPVVLTSCTFSGCSANAYGGAIYSKNQVVLTSCIFSDCSVTGDGGAIYSEAGSLNATSCVFSGCNATQNAGAIYSKTSVVLTSCTFTNCNADNGPDAFYLLSGVPCNMNFCRIYKYQDTAISSAIMQISAENNWWGSGSITNIIVNADTNPYLKSGITATPSVITTSGTSTIKANLTHNSNGDDTSGSGLFVPDGIPVAFSATSGTLSVSGGNVSSGVNTTVFTPESAGTAMISAVIDGVTVSVPVTVLEAGFTGDPITGTAPLDVNFTDASGGSPTAWNWSFGDGEWFNTTTSSNPVHTYDTAGTYTVNLTVSRSGVTDTLSRAGYVNISAVPAPQPTVAPDNGGSSGGSGGDGSNTDTGVGATGSLNAGETASFGFEGKGAVGELSITAGDKISKVMVTVKSQKNTPSDVDEPETDVYEYEDVTVYYLEPSGISGGTFDFKVEKSWLESNGYDISDIVMLHYNEETGEWEELLTTFAGEDGGYYYYSSQTPSFSLFAIAYSEGAAIVPEKAAPDPASESDKRVKTTAPATAPSETETPVPAVSTEKGLSLSPLIIPGIFLIVIGIVASGFIWKRRRDKYPDWWDHGRGRK